MYLAWFLLDAGDAKGSFEDRVGGPLLPLPRGVQLTMAAQVLVSRVDRDELAP